MTVIGIDVGGTKLLATALEEGRPSREVRRATGRDLTPDALLDLIDDVCEDLDVTPRAIGIGFPGLVDASRGVVRSSVMLDGWHEVDLAARIARRRGVPCVLENDVDAAAVAEVHLRGGLPAGGLVFVAVGTGIGGSVVLDGRPLRGALGITGEVGHMVVDMGQTDSPLRWAHPGSLNALASGSALEARTGRTGPALLRAWEAEEPPVVAAVEDAARALGAGIANVVSLLGPGLVALGGGVAGLGPRWLERVREGAQGVASAESLQACPFVLSAAGYGAGALGAALVAREVA